MLMKLTPGWLISPTIYKQLCGQIQKHKNTLTDMTALLGSVCVKAVHKHVDDIAPIGASLTDVKST
jgi:hypothetical protein